MKTLRKIKLNQLCREELLLKKEEMAVVKGAIGPTSGSCTCVCWGDSFPESSRPIESHSNQAV